VTKERTGRKGNLQPRRTSRLAPEERRRGTDCPTRVTKKGKTIYDERGKHPLSKHGGKKGKGGGDQEKGSLRGVIKKKNSLSRKSGPRRHKTTPGEEGLRKKILDEGMHQWQGVNNPESNAKEGESAPVKTELFGAWEGLGREK